MFDWFAATLKQYPEIAIFLTLALGYYFGKFTFKGIGLGSVTATLLAGVVIGQIGITIAQPLKATVFLMFLFAVGYAVGPQFVRGVAKDGLPQALFSVVQCVFCLIVPVAIVKFVGYDLGYAAGLYSGSQTISAAMGLSTDAINRMGLAADQAKALIDSMPVAYAVTYMFGTMGSAIVIAIIGPKLLGINLVAACKDYELKQRRHQGTGRARLGLAPVGSAGIPRREAVGRAAGLRVSEAEAPGSPDSRSLRCCACSSATANASRRRRRTPCCTKATSSPSQAPRSAGDAARDDATEVEDPELLAMPVGGVDVLVSNKAVDGKTLAELAQMPESAGVFLRKIVQRRNRHLDPHPAEYHDPARRPAHDRRPHAGHERRHQAAGCCRSCDRRLRHRVHRRGHRDWRPDRLAGPQHRWSSADVVHRWRGARRGNRRRLAAVGAPDASDASRRRPYGS